MVNDLLNFHKLVGLSKAEIEDLLGPPLDNSRFLACEAIYWLGPERGFISIDSGLLVIPFEGDRVVGVHLRPD